LKTKDAIRGVWRVIGVRERERTGRKDTEGVGRTAWRGRMSRRAPRDSADLMRPL